MNITPSVKRLKSPDTQWKLLLPSETGPARFPNPSLQAERNVHLPGKPILDSAKARIHCHVHFTLIIVCSPIPYLSRYFDPDHTTACHYYTVGRWPSLHHTLAIMVLLSKIHSPRPPTPRCLFPCLNASLTPSPGQKKPAISQEDPSPRAWFAVYSTG